MELVAKTLEKETGKKVNMVIALQLDDGNHHIQQVKINVPNDHHFLDMLCDINEEWWKNNHKEKHAEGQTCHSDV